MMSSRGMSGQTLFIMYKFSPTGGEMTAISILRHKIIPYHIGSNPIDNTAGSKIGVVMTIIEIPSTNIPINTSRNIKKTITPNGGKGRDREKLANLSGILITFKKFPKHRAEATITQIAAVDRVERYNIFSKVFIHSTDYLDWPIL